VKALLFYDPVSTVVKVNAANDVGDTPLHVASKWGYGKLDQNLAFSLLLKLLRFEISSSIAAC